ncbi:response regulator transcription factor [Eremococcus coleocola]|uniref:Response regulator receiver domain protein n=1 Tax=Eremococcus coleocola ACS-139-V-Col8 TaxID=908337 RepID=E4KPA6_9LACT|nr:response regulator transcription factor [Eremococcus coleocola]EFR31272.1 response regulator receiver domain protein [Eremococcus coleocola ACS-139-V-Col8]
MDQRKILIIEDDVDLVDMLEMYLEDKNITIVKAYSSVDIPEDLSAIDLILLDINLPGNNGFEICKQLRERWLMPILFLSARVNEADKIEGLMLGGDDYITKPFSLDELYARIYTNLTRSDRVKYLSKNNQVRLIEGCVFSLNGVALDLTKSEFEILELLVNNPKQIFSKERIYDSLWGIDSFGNPQVVSEHIRNIRNKMAEVSDQEFIKTHWGLGYSWIG